MSAEIADVIRGQLAALFPCSELRAGAVRVDTPLLMPDGDLIFVVIERRDGELVVTDHGEALSWLSYARGIEQLNERQAALVESFCRTLGVRLERGALLATCEGELAANVFAVAQAMSWIAALMERPRAETAP